MKPDSKPKKSGRQLSSSPISVTRKQAAAFASLFPQCQRT
jgi:hypothetical protein